MRTIETERGPVEVRSLNRAEIRGGKEFGMSYLGPGLTIENFDDYRDYVLGCMLDDATMDALSNVELNRIMDALIRETWGDVGEEKNSSGSGQSDQTHTE
jgi:hypothetical protein